MDDLLIVLLDACMTKSLPPTKPTSPEKTAAFLSSNKNNPEIQQFRSSMKTSFNILLGQKVVIKFSPSEKSTMNDKDV